MVDIWTVALTIAGAVGIGVIADRVIAGGAGLQIAITVIGEILDVIKTVVSFLLDNMPRPIKMALFLVLFVSLGGLIYNYSVGAQYVCLEDDVYKVDITEGLAVNFWPPVLEQQDTDQEQERRQEADPRLNESFATATGDTYWRVTRDTNLFSANEYVDPDILTDNDILYSREDVVLQESGEQIRFDEIVYATTSYGDIINDLWVDAVFRTEGDTQRFFTAWMGGDQQATYQVCRDVETNTCRLSRLDLSSWGSLFGYSVGTQEDFADGCEGGSIGTDEAGLYGEVVGSITYAVNDDGTLTGAFRESSNVFGGIVDRIVRGGIEDVCGTADSEDRQRTEKTYSEILGTEEDPNSPQEVVVYKSGVFEGGERVKIPLYGTSRVPVITDIDTGYVFVDKTNPDPGANVQVGQNTEVDLFNSPEKVEPRQGEIVTFSCNEKTENRFDTRMFIGGIDIFDPKLMVLFVLLSFIIGFYRTMNVF